MGRNRFVGRANAWRGRGASRYGAARRTGFALQRSAAGKTLACAVPLALAGSLAARARGLLRSRPSGEALLLMPCGDVHTVGMRHPIDIAFVDASGVVIESYRHVGPFRRLRKKGAVAVVERFSSCTGPWFRAGDRVGLASVERGRS